MWDYIGRFGPLNPGTCGWDGHCWYETIWICEEKDGA